MGGVEKYYIYHTCYMAKDGDESQYELVHCQKSPRLNPSGRPRITSGMREPLPQIPPPKKPAPLGILGIILGGEVGTCTSLKPHHLSCIKQHGWLLKRGFNRGTGCTTDP